MPTTADRASTALEELTTALQNPEAAKPFLDTGNKLNADIDALSEILTKRRSTTPSSAASPRVGPPTVASDNPNITNKRQLRTRVRTKIQTTVYKIFKDKIHQGYICEFDSKEGFYKVKYRDGDIEEGDKNDIAKILKPPNKTSWKQALAATRFERGQARYCKLEEAMPIPSKFLNGFGNAVAYLDYQNGQAFIPGQQDYKYKACAVIDETTGKAIEYRDLLKDPKHKDTWSRAASNEFGRLFNGVGTKEDGTKRIIGTNMCIWIPKIKVPAGKRVTYARTVVAVRREKAEPNRVRITVSGNLLEYLGETSTDAASIETSKILFNSVLSTPGARFGTIDITNFYIQNFLKDYQYMRFHISMIPKEIIDEYNLTTIMEPDGWCYVEIQKAMYGLKESGYIANQELKEVLGKQGYIPGLSCRSL